jgi:hypothetical protein
VGDAFSAIQLPGTIKGEDEGEDDSLHASLPSLNQDFDVKENGDSKLCIFLWE